MKLSGIYGELINEQGSGGFGDTTIGGSYLDIDNNVGNYDYTEGGNDIKIEPWMRGQIGSIYMFITVNGNKIQFIITPKGEEYDFEALKIEGPETNNFKPTEDPSHLIQRAKEYMVEKTKDIFDMINQVGVDITTDPDISSISNLEISNS